MKRDGWLRALAAHGERPALRLGACRLDYMTLAARAAAVAGELDALGLVSGDLVAILAPPSLPGVALLHAALDRGLVVLPLNARLTEAEQREALEASRVRWLVVDPAEGALGQRLAGEAGCGLARLDSEAFRDAGAAAPALAPMRTPPTDPEAGSRRARLRAEGAALVLRTSGTSGVPKGAVIGFDALLASADAQAALLGGDERDRWLLCMPLFHIGGLSIPLRAARAGAEVVLHARFDAAAVARALDDEGITRVSFVATMLARVIGARGDRRAPPGLALVLLGGGPAGEALLERAEALGYPVAPTYGLTETASQAATRPPGRAPGPGVDRAGGLVPLPGVEIRVVDAQRRPVAAGVEGEIEVRGPIVMQGYLDDPVATAAAIVDGWLRTGDVGRLDARGALRVLDRRADLIVSGGENVYPAEIESVLEAHPDVAEAGVIGIADPEFGARPAACVVARPGRSLDASMLTAHCRERLAAYKTPVAWVVFGAGEALPRTATGKLMRRALADRVAAAARS